MWKASDEIKRAADKFGIQAPLFRRCDTEEGAEIRRRAMGKFVEGSPRAWWMGLRNATKLTTASDLLRREPPTAAFEWLSKQRGRAWLVPHDSDDCVFEVDVARISDLLHECPLFEFSVVDCGYRWLIAESDHDEVFLIQD